MSYGTGSVGLNLQFTNYVFLFDRWWNPAIEDQAINRAHRLGQKHPVTVTRFLSRRARSRSGSRTMLEAKRKVFNDLLVASGQAGHAGADRGRNLRPVRHQGEAEEREALRSSHG